MSVIPLGRARGIVAGVTPLRLPAERGDSRQFVTNTATRVHHLTAPLLGALTDALRSAAAQGVHDSVPEQQPGPGVTPRSTSPLERPAAHSDTEKYLSAPWGEPTRAAVEHTGPTPPRRDRRDARDRSSACAFERRDTA
jgi:hypothetical protein